MSQNPNNVITSKNVKWILVWFCLTIWIISFIYYLNDTQSLFWSFVSEANFINNYIHYIIFLLSSNVYWPISLILYVSITCSKHHVRSKSFVRRFYNYKGTYSWLQWPVSNCTAGHRQMESLDVYLVLLGQWKQVLCRDDSYVWIPTYIIIIWSTSSLTDCRCRLPQRAVCTTFPITWHLHSGIV